MEPVDAASVDAALLSLPMGKKLILPIVKNAGSRTLQEATATLEPDPFLTLYLIQASRMTSLVSDNLMGASSSFPTPPQEKVLVRRSRRDATGSLNLLDDDSRKPKQRSRMRERMLSDSHWLMCDLDRQAITSGTTRTAGVRTGRWADIQYVEGRHVTDVRSDFEGHSPTVINCNFHR